MSGFEHINRIEAMRNRLAAGETTFTLDELKLTLAWADHLNYFRSLDIPRLTALEAELAASREKFTMHTAAVHAWFSALLQEMGIASEGETVDVATACSKAMDWVGANKATIERRNT